MFVVQLAQGSEEISVPINTYQLLERLDLSIDTINNSAPMWMLQSWRNLLQNNKQHGTAKAFNKCSEFLIERQNDVLTITEKIPNIDGLSDQNKQLFSTLLDNPGISQQLDRYTRGEYSNSTGITLKSTIAVSELPEWIKLYFK